MNALLLAVLLTVQSSAEFPADEYVVPTEQCRGFWMIPVTLRSENPEAEPRTLWFLHDTGASNTFVDPDALERVSGRRFSEGRRVNITDATAGPVQINRLPARVRELDHLSVSLGREIDGLMSVHALDDFLMILDYPAAQMRLRRGALPAPDGETVFSSRGRDRRPWLMVNFADRNQRLLIDSGAAGLAFAVNDIDQFSLAEPAREVAGAVRFDRLEARRASRLDGSARVAGLSFQSPVLEEVPRSALLGGEALRHFVVTLDQANRRVAFVPATQDPVPAQDHFEFGALLRPSRAGLEVVRLFSGLPFDAAGVQVGDLITHFNTVAIEGRGCEPLTATDPLSLTLIRDGAELELTAVLTPVFEAPD